jgi:hypothetical protein
MKILDQLIEEVRKESNNNIKEELKILCDKIQTEENLSEIEKEILGMGSSDRLLFIKCKKNGEFFQYLGLNFDINFSNPIEHSIKTNATLYRIHHTILENNKGLPPIKLIPIKTYQINQTKPKKIIKDFVKLVIFYS